MSLTEVNDALQRATRKGNWIQWGCKFEDCKIVDDIAQLANTHGHVELGLLSEGLDVLMARMPKREAELDIKTGIR